MNRNHPGEGVRAEAIRRYLLDPALQEVDLLRDEAVGELQLVNTQLESLTDVLADVAQSPATSGPSIYSEFPYNLSADVPPDTPRSDPVIEKREAPHDAIVTHVSAVSTEGAAQRVGAQVKKSSGERWFPRDPPDDAQFVPLDDHPVETDLGVPIDKGETFEVRYISNDPDNSRFARTIINLQERDDDD